MGVALDMASSEGPPEVGPSSLSDETSSLHSFSPSPPPYQAYDHHNKSSQTSPTLPNHRDHHSHPQQTENDIDSPDNIYENITPSQLCVENENASAAPDNESCTVLSSRQQLLIPSGSSSSLDSPASSISESIIETSSTSHPSPNSSSSALVLPESREENVHIDRDDNSVQSTSSSLASAKQDLVPRISTKNESSSTLNIRAEIEEFIDSMFNGSDEQNSSSENVPVSDDTTTTSSVTDNNVDKLDLLNDEKDDDSSKPKFVAVGALDLTILSDNAGTNVPLEGHGAVGNGEGYPVVLALSSSGDQNTGRERVCPSSPDSPTQPFQHVSSFKRTP